MAIQSACRANAFTVVSTGVSTLRIRSKIHPTDAAPPKTAAILRNGYARVLLISISEGRMRTTTRRSHRAASSVAPHSWPKLSARRAGSSSAPGGLSTPLLLNLATVAVRWECEGELHFLTLISAERVQEGSHCGRSGLRLRRLWILAMALAKLLVQTRYPQNSTKIRPQRRSVFFFIRYPLFFMADGAVGPGIAAGSSESSRSLVVASLRALSAYRARRVFCSLLRRV